MIDCLLINSPDELFSGHYVADPKMPLGLLYVAAMLKKEQFGVSVIDCHTNSFTPADILDKIASCDPRIIGLNITSPNRKVVFGLVQKIKEAFPAIPVIVGGPHATSFPRDIFKNCPADGAVLGEGEISIVKVLKSLPSLDGFEGFYTRNDYLQAKVPLQATRMVGLDILPFPDFSLLEIDKYLSVSNELYMTCSRGCRYNCAFCSVRTLLGRSIESRSAENVVAEMRALNAKHGVTKFYFYDDDLVMWPGLKSFCQAMVGSGLQWTAQATINDIRAEDIPVLAKSGCYRLSFGFESGSKSIQKYIGKVIQERSINLLPVFAEYGIETRGYFILGFPQETLENIAETLLYIVKLRRLGLNDVSVFAARPYPGTRLFSQCVELFGEERIEELLDFYYADDYRNYTNAVVRDKLHRYNTLPAFQINPRFNSDVIRDFVALAFSVFSDYKSYQEFTLSEMLLLLNERLQSVVPHERSKHGLIHAC